MPFNIDRKTLLYSKAFNTLTPGAELFAWRFLDAADDEGRVIGGVWEIKDQLYAGRQVDIRDIPGWIAECHDAGVIGRERSGPSFILTWVLK